MQENNSPLAHTIKARYHKHSTVLETRRGYNPSYSWRSIWGAKSLLLQGLKWQVGNGRNIRVWDDAWLPGNSSSCVVTPNVNCDPNMLVVELIDEESATWKTDLLNSLLSLDEARFVSGIGISPRLPTDRMLWRPMKNGFSSVKSAYWLGRLGVVRSWTSRLGVDEEKLCKMCGICSHLPSSSTLRGGQ